MMKDAIIFVKHALENIKDIEDFSQGLTKNTFKHDKLKQKAIIRSLEIIGEAVKNIPAAFRNKHITIEWTKIAGLRDKLIHQYFGVDLDIVWAIVQEDLPKLKKEIQQILEFEKKER